MDCLVENRNALASRVRDIVSKYSRLADSIVRAQCRNLGKTPETITDSDLERLAESIGKALAMFTTPEKGALATQAIRRLSSPS